MFGIRELKFARRGERRIPAFIQRLLAASLLFAPICGSIASRFDADYNALCEEPHRLAGSTECGKAADYIVEQLSAAGIEEVIRQPFFVPARETKCVLIAGGNEYPLFAMRANLWQLPVSGPEPISGRAIFAADGSPESYGDEDPAGRIVVLNYETARRWRDAFAMGAKAVIFVESGGEPISFPRYESISADLPRFYMRAEDAVASGLLGSGIEARIEARGNWRRAEAENILAWIPGSDPTFSLQKEEVMVISAQLDSLGEVPELSRGARGAANCAALLDIARRLNAERPRRSVLIAFLGGESRCLSGSFALYSGIFRARPFLSHKRTHSDFISEYESEKNLISEMIEAIRTDEIIFGKGAGGRQGLDILRRNAESQTQDIQARLRSERLQQKDRSTLEAIEALERDEQAWNSLRRAFAKGIMTSDARPCLDLIRDETVVQLENREKELSAFIRHRVINERIGALLSNKAIVLHLAFDLGADGPLWGVALEEKGLIGGGQYNQAGYYTGVFSALSALADELSSGEAGQGLGAFTEKRLRYLEPETAKIQLGPPVHFPADSPHAGLAASRFGVYGLSIRTCLDRMPRSGHPSDSPEYLDSERIKLFAEDAIPLIAAAASHPALSLRQRIRPTAIWNEPEWTGRSMRGCNAMTTGEGSAIANQPAAGALLAMTRDCCLPAFDAATRRIIDQNGYFSVGPEPEWSQSDAWLGNSWCCALLDENARIRSVNNGNSTLQRIEMFPCAQYTVTMLAPPDFSGAANRVLNAASDSQFQPREFFSMERGTVTTFFVPTFARAIKLINSTGMLLLNADAERSGGIGFELGPGWQPISTEERAAADLLFLNEYRFEILRKRRITNDSLEWLHGLAGAALRRSSEAKDVASRYAEASMSARLSRRVYEPLLSSMNDLVKAAVILLLLTIPFSYALERLLIGTPHIYRRIGWYSIFFILTFIILYNVHPAFAIAAEPIVIFLAFIIIILSAIVIFILLSRFQSELKTLQGLRATIHSADVSRFGTLMAATAMGISTMRRRPIRTALTTVTVVLLTFSILSFASFDAQVGIHKRYAGAAAEVRCVFAHHALWSALPDRIVDLIHHLTGDSSLTAERYWVAASSATEAEYYSLLVADENGDKSVRLKGLVGLDSLDIRKQTELKACLPTFAADSDFPVDGIFLPPTAADALGLTGGEPVLVQGRKFKFIGPFDARKLTLFAQVDGSPIFPVDFGDASMAMNKQAQSRAGQTRETEELQYESAFLPYLNANQVGLIGVPAARELEGKLIAVTVYPDERTDIQLLADRLARISPAPIYATLSDGVTRLFFTTILSTSGMRNILIPVLLGGLIVFGTMLGSVSDREKEIYSFSSLGLAPAHIGMLFFAEAAVYAVVGGLGGYLLAQVVAFGSGWLSEFSAVRLPEMNYSSTNAIFAILVVMGTVMLSTIYPAMVGSRSANPGVARTWRLPAPKGDDWSFTFPFTVSEYDITGVMNFLYEHFNDFSDCSLGLFLAEGTKVFRDGRSLMLQSKIATAPFDLGVTQDFTLSSVPSEIDGVDEVHIEIKRLSGTKGDWLRTNRPFIANLRKQFLIWRSLSATTMEEYRLKTLLMLGEMEGHSEKNGG